MYVLNRTLIMFKEKTKTKLKINETTNIHLCIYTIVVFFEMQQQNYCVECIIELLLVFFQLFFVVVERVSNSKSF